MKKILGELKGHSISFYALNIYLILSVFLPKDLSNIFGLPVRLIFTGLLVLLILRDIKLKKIEVNNSKYKFILVLIAIFIVAIIPSIIVSKSLITSLYTLCKFLSFLVMFVILYKIKFTKREYLILLGNLLICAFIITIIGIVQYNLGINIMIKNSGIYYYPGAKGRVITTFFNTIYFGIFINLIYALVLYLVIKTNNKKIAMFGIILSLLLYINLVYTFTRSTMLIFWGILFLLIVLLNKKLFKINMLLILVLTIMISIITPGAVPLIKKSTNDIVLMAGKISTFLPSIEETTNVNEPQKNESDNAIDYVDDNKVDENNNEDNVIDNNKADEFVDYSLQHRESFAKIANTIANDNLYTGVGFGAYIDYMNSDNFTLKYPNYNLSKTHPHSSMLLLFSETGIFGILSFIILLIAIVLKSVLLIVKNFKKNEKVFEVATLAFVIITGFLVINVMSENAFYDTQICYLFFGVYGMLLSYCYSSPNKE